MAEATGLRNTVLPYPIYGVPYGIIFPIFDADGDLVTGAAGLDSEISKNGDTFADCTNEATEIASSSGMYYLLLTATEMTTDVASIIVKTSTSGAKTTPIVLYPRALPIERSGTAQAGAASTITLDASASDNDDYYNGCVIHLDGGTGSGQVRVITDYNGMTKIAAVTPAFATTPNATTTWDIYVPETANAQVKGAVDDLMAEVVEATKTYKQMLIDIWAQTVGDSEADDANDPSVVTYDSPDGTVQITHTLGSKTRSVS